jgi:hypothetical protein
VAEVALGTDGQVLTSTGTTTAPDDGANFDKTVGLGNPYLNYAMAAFEFGPDGLPWMRMWGHAYKVGADLKLIRKTNGSLSSARSNYWHTAAHGATINHSMNTYAYGGSSNLTITGSNSFVLLGGYFNLPSYNDPGATMMKFDFTSNTFDKLMGDIAINGVESDTGGAVAAADLRAFSFWLSCRTLSCFTRYDSTDDRVYFSESSKIRYVSNVNIGTANRELKTVFTAQSGGTINNFILSLDRSKIFYVSAGKLFCAEMDPDPMDPHAWCNETDLGPDSAMNTILPGTSQMTWKDASTLLISNYRGEILQFILPAE